MGLTDTPKGMRLRPAICAPLARPAIRQVHADEVHT
jgi:hypothetical protein